MAQTVKDTLDSARQFLTFEERPRPMHHCKILGQVTANQIMCIQNHVDCRSCNVPMLYPEMARDILKREFSGMVVRHYR